MSRNGLAPDNWARFHLSLNHAELVQFALETASGAQMLADTCTFDEPAQGGYARAILTPLDLGAGRHLDCGEGFESDEP